MRNPLCNLHHWARPQVKAGISFLVLGLLITGPAWSAGSGMMGVDDMIELDKQGEKPKVQLSQPNMVIETPLQGLVSQHYSVSDEDNENLGMLWGNTIARNPAIQFGLKQLNTPPELRYKHTSMLNRSIAALISGASMIPYAMGASQYAAGGAVVGANMANRAYQQVSAPGVDVSTLPSDAELVELSSLVHDLQESLVRNYFLYKSTLTGLVQLNEQLDRLGQQYHTALESSDPLDDLWVGELYHHAQYEQLQARNSAKEYYYIMQRIAGTEALEKMRFGLALHADDEPATPTPSAQKEPVKEAPKGSKPPANPATPTQAATKEGKKHE